MKIIALKSILAGTGLAAALAFTPANAQDSVPRSETTVQTETILDFDPHEFTLEDDMPAEPQDSIITTPNDRVLGAFETNDPIIDDSFDPANDSEIAGDINVPDNEDDFIISDGMEAGTEMVIEPEITGDTDFVIDPEDAPGSPIPPN